MSAIEDARRHAALVAQARLLGIEPWQLEAMDAVPDDLIRDIVSDSRRGATQPSSIIPGPAAAPVPKGSGWVEPAPLAPPPGIDLMDRMMDAQDARDLEQEEMRIAPQEQRRKRRV